MKKITFIIALLIILSQTLYAYDFQLQKINEPYTSDLYIGAKSGEQCIYSIGYRAFHIFDIDNEGHLQLINELPLYGHLHNLEINGEYVYICAQVPPTAVILYRIFTENHNPILTDSLFFPYPATYISVFKSNDYSFIQVEYPSNNCTTMLYIYNNEPFELLAQYNIDNDFGCMSFNKINDDYVFGLDPENYMLLHIYDISNIYNIHHIGDIDLTDSNVELGMYQSLNDSIFVFCGYYKYTFFDISNIIDWEIKLQMEFSDNSPVNRNFAKLLNNRIVIPRYYTQDLYDMSDITNPVLLDTIDGGCSWNSCGIYQNYYYVPSFDYGISEFMVENDRIKEISIPPKFPALHRAFKNNDNLIIQTSRTSDLHFFDVSDIYNPQYVCTHFEDYELYGIHFYGNKMAVSKIELENTDNRSIDIYDITDIENPLLLNSIDNTISLVTRFANSDTLFTVEYRSGEYHFIKYDISEPGTPDILFDFTLPGLLCGFDIYGNYAYFRDENNLYVIGNIESNAPEIINILNINEGFGLRIEGGYLLIFSSSQIELYDLSDPTYPVCEYVFIREYVEGIGVHNNLVFAGYCDVGVYDLDNCSYYIEDPIYSFHTNFGLKKMIFFEEDDNQYFYFVEQTCVTLYEYEYNNAEVNEWMISQDKMFLTNYPNPFSTSTTISLNLATGLRYATPRQAKSHERPLIKIYNIKGQLVRKLSIVNSQSSIEWDGKDENGKEMPNGIYFYQLKLNNEIVKTNKMVLMR